ncbi:MAG: hypothetical protein QOF70_5698 [Acetobacteraceae bacterium]|jgi:hypothetical protein|nr:hypothetical protein [Acetobacteraceae bacterium]
MRWNCFEGFNAELRDKEQAAMFPEYDNLVSNDFVWRSAWAAIIVTFADTMCLAKETVLWMIAHHFLLVSETATGRAGKNSA